MKMCKNLEIISAKKKRVRSRACALTRRTTDDLLRRMLDICSLYAHDHGLLFNASKIQLICFRSCKNCRFLPLITFNNTALPYKNEVIHLGHVLSSDLNDGPDVTRALKDLNRKANCSLCTFYFTDSYVKCFLVKLYCLALYGCCLWHLGSKSLYSLQTALNKIMRKVWHLPSRCHVPIVHCVAKTTNILRIIYGRFITLGAHAQRGLL